MATSSIERLTGSFFHWLNRNVVWHHLPFPLAVLNVLALRINLRLHNLYDTERGKPASVEPGTDDIRHARTADGSYNDLAVPTMGRASARFGRNMPIKETFGETGPGLMTPSPRVISRRLLTRETFTPATTLNVLAAGWLQFMVHDWFSHGAGAPPAEKKPLDVPLDKERGDHWFEDPMTVLQSTADPDCTPDDEGLPTTYRNTETHWWDGSQIYGSSVELQHSLRTDPATGRLLPDGKIHLREGGHLPVDEAGNELSGVNGNWWIGLSSMQTLFAREHNSIADMLKAEHPARASDGEWLFQKARLVNAALMAKIHTTEWTPALLDTPELRFGMRANWWGLLGEDYWLANGRVGNTEELSGIPGSPTDHHTAPYAMTEEFTAVYRMHSLIPDSFSFRRRDDDASLLECGLLDVNGRQVAGIYDRLGYENVLYSLGTSHPGAMVLHNFPKSLQNLRKDPDDTRIFDLATIDVLRDRERGVPRYCQFRRLLDMSAPKTFAELTDNPVWAKELEEVYGDVEKVDLVVGVLAETAPKGFGFSDTAFRIFILMASRRIKSDRFFTNDYTPEVYTPAGMSWIARNGMRSVLLRHVPALAPQLGAVRNMFFPWPRSDG